MGQLIQYTDNATDWALEVSWFDS